MKTQKPQFIIFVLCLILFSTLPGRQLSERYKGSVFELKEELSIGTDDGSEEYWFNDIADFDVDSKGNIYVADYKESRIKIYDARGKYLKTIGRKGQGPGEFQGLWKIFISKNDVLYTSDVTQRKLTVFNPDGKFETSFSFPKMGMSVRDFFVVNDGSFILIESYPARSEKERKTVSEINLYSREMTFIRNIFSCDNFSWDAAVIGKRKTFVRKPYPLTLKCSLMSADKIVFGRNDTYEFFFHSIDKNSTQKFHGIFVPLRVTKEDKESFLEFYKQMSRGEPHAHEFLKATSFPNTKPPFYSVIIDDTGYIIFVTYERDKEKGTGCDIYDLQGDFIKKVFIKGIPVLTAMNVRWNLKFRNGGIFASLYTENGYPIVVRYRLKSVE